MASESAAKHRISLIIGPLQSERSVDFVGCYRRESHNSLQLDVRIKFLDQREFLERESRILIEHHLLIMKIELDY